MVQRTLDHIRKHPGRLGGFLAGSVLTLMLALAAQSLFLGYGLSENPPAHSESFYF